ncbi:hypothetical protein ACFY3U_17355 [Micromonospora sp. NPDC000089]|uniref:hypothetical protein n=1 Tax=unclassified Micromonospora TaxID=2617518 RepID=UPI0036B0EE7F
MDEDLSFVDRLHGELSAVRWPEPAELRARARRRSRRTAVSAAVAVLVVASASAAVAARPSRDPDPEPAPVAAPATLTGLRAEIPLDALLPTAALPAPAAAPLTTAGIGEGVRVDDMLMACLREKGVPAAEWRVSRYSRSQTVLQRRPTDGPEREPLLIQDVYRMSAAAGGVFDDLDRYLASCGEWRSTDQMLVRGRETEVTATHRWAVAARDFAGDQAVLLRHTVSGPLPVGTYAGTRSEQAKPVDTAVVRSGDLVSVLTPAAGGSEAQVKGLAAVAARQLCRAANPPC